MSFRSSGNVDAESILYDPWTFNAQFVSNFEPVDSNYVFNHETSAAADEMGHGSDSGTVDLEPIDSDNEIICDVESICDTGSVDDSSDSVTSDDDSLCDSETSDDESVDDSNISALARLHDYEIPDLESMYIPSMPYEDPREFDARRYRHTTYYPYGVEYENVHKSHAPDSVYEAHLSDAAVSNREGTIFRNQSGSYYLATGIFHRLVHDGKLRKIPRLIQAMLATKKTKLLPLECLRVSQNPNFIPLWGGQSPGSYGDKDEGTFVHIADDNSIHYPVVYFVSYLGFVVSCIRTWMKQKTAVKYLNAGTGDVIGFRSFKNKANRTICRWLVVNFKLLRAAPNAESYRYVNLSDEDCSNTRYMSAVAGLLAAAYYGARPTTLHIVHHVKDRFNNNLKLLKWITHQENMLKKNITPGYDLSLRESTVILDIKYKDCSDKEIWIPHPYLPIKINVNGDHCFCLGIGRCIPITVITYKLWKENAKVPLVKVMVTIDGKTYIFYRLVLECKLQDMLTDKEFVDHKDRDRTNNEMRNLQAVSSLESANNKSTTSTYRENGEMRGVYYKEGEFFMVQDSDYKVFEEKLRSRPRKKYFCFYQYGGPENAERRAKLFREEKMKENASFRKNHSLQHRGRLEDGKPMNHIEESDRAPKHQRSQRALSGSDLKKKEEIMRETREEINLLNNQRLRLNKARALAGLERLSKRYTVDECARLPFLKHHAEAYLLRFVDPTEHDNVLNEYHLLKRKYLALMITSEEQSNKENNEANGVNDHDNCKPAALPVKPTKRGTVSRNGDPNPTRTKAKLAKAVEALRANSSLSELDALRRNGFDYPDGATQFDTDGDNVELLYRTRALRRRLNMTPHETNTEVKFAKAVEALRADSSLSELDALRQNGFAYPNGALNSDIDDDGVKLGYRKRALRRRLGAAVEPNKKKSLR